VLGHSLASRKIRRRPGLLIDFLALMGDKFRQHSRLPWCRRETRVGLITVIGGGLDMDLRNLDKDTGVNHPRGKETAEKLLEFKEMGLSLTYQLATIKVDVELD